MRTLKLIGIGAGNPDYITVQAINALAQVNVVFVTDKGEASADLLRARQSICERYLRPGSYRIVEIADPARERTPDDYTAAVRTWHHQRADAYERLIREHLSDTGCGAFLVWGDPSIYDSTLRIIEQLAQRAVIEFDYEIIPGISSVQALAARHKLSLNQIGAPIRITTGRRLSEGKDLDESSVVVMLDGECAFRRLTDADLEIYWGAYLGTADELLISGKLEDVSEQIERTRSQARRRKGWIMDTYLLRKRPGPT